MNTLDHREHSSRPENLAFVILSTSTESEEPIHPRRGQDMAKNLYREQRFLDSDDVHTQGLPPNTFTRTPRLNTKMKTRSGPTG